jgi:hypothetical protein
MLRIITTAVFIFVLVSSVPGYAAVPVKKAPAKLQPDTSNISVKKFDAGALNHFKSDKDFNYDGPGINRQESIWTRFWNWVWHILFGWLGNATYGKYFQYFLLGISAGFLVYVIFKSIGLDLVKLMHRDAQKVSVPYTESLENIHEIDFDAEIENAVLQHNYRLAVRLIYLNCLKQLSDNHFIQWQIDKTNSAYIFELTNPELRQIFSQLTRRFEYVWYGNFSIDKQTFGNVNQLFQNFLKQLP